MKTQVETIEMGGKQAVASAQVMIAVAIVGLLIAIALPYVLAV